MFFLKKQCENVSLLLNTDTCFSFFFNEENLKVEKSSMVWLLFLSFVYVLVLVAACTGPTGSRSYLLFVFVIVYAAEPCWWAVRGCILQLTD